MLGGKKLFSYAKLKRFAVLFSLSLKKTKVKCEEVHLMVPEALNNVHQFAHVAL